MSKGASAVELHHGRSTRGASASRRKWTPTRGCKSIVAHRVGAGAEVLSVGCGPGVILREMVALGKSIKATGLDVSADRIQEAKERHRGVEAMSFVRGDAHAMEFPTESL